ncbi:hypothetical protein L564_0489 [Bordetella pertussis CHLA-15]|nr:hypothetical protein L564_0489 [Bordetella pertussis CHLA-15]
MVLPGLQTILGKCPASCEDSIGCMHGSSEPDLRNWKFGRAVPISRLNLDEYNLLTVHS